MICGVLITHSSLFTMRQATTKTNFAAKLTPAAFKNIGSYPVQPSVVNFPSYEASNFQSSKNNVKNDKQKPKWYQRKAFKYPMVFSGASVFLDNYLEQQQYQSILNESDDVAEKDPELYAVMLQIKKDLGITNKVNFRIRHKAPFEQAMGEFKIGRKNPDNPLPEIPCTVLLTPDYKLLSKPDLIHTIAHELEHVRQHLQYLGSYHARESSSDVRMKKRETAADAASADYQYCSECLHDVASSYKGFIKHEPHDTEHGYFTTEYGYFSSQDYQLYIDRACEDNAMCKAHRSGTHDSHGTSLKDFLPQK